MAIFNRKKNGNENKESDLLRRQSALKPTPNEEAERLSDNMHQSHNPNANEAVNGFQVIAQVIGKEQVQKANQTLLKYTEGKTNLDRCIVENEQWYKLRHWECLRDKNNEVQPTSAWLFNCIANKHADAMDSFPAPNILPREENDKGEAEMLTSIIPVILDQCDFEQTYSDVMQYKIKNGTGVYGVFWDKNKLNGLGDITIKKVDLINLFWESGITDIQKSRNLFHLELVDNDLLVEQYPQLENKLGGETIRVSKYLYDDTVDTSNKSIVVDWYYKKNQNGKLVLHYCKYVNDEVLFATENIPEFAEKGLYDHSEYPFVFDVLFPIEGTPTGFGYIDIGKDAQTYIDRGNQAIMQNTLANAKPRYFVKNDGSVNIDEYADMTKDFIHVDGNLGQDSIVPVTGKPLSSIYVEVINNKIDELKETTGNRDISTGGTTSGVTAASAIAAMQEAGSKLSRDNNKASYRAFRKLCLMVVELIRQFYDLPRCFRIMGENGTARYVQYSNAGIQPQMQGIDFGMDMGMRLPLFDIEITAQKQSPYSKMSQNELALQFFNAGFFNPQIADQALACLDMMDFDRKDFIMQKISQNGGMYQRMLMMQQQMMQLGAMVDNAHGTSEVTDSLMNQFGMQSYQAQGNAPGSAEDNSALGGDMKTGETENTKKARQRVADSTSPT
nr:MAG TPA: portal protein [Caudoviricetes sp.]